MVHSYGCEDVRIGRVASSLDSDLRDGPIGAGRGLTFERTAVLRFPAVFKALRHGIGN